MTELSQKKSDEIAATLRGYAVDNRVSRGQLKAVARLNGVAEGIVIGVAREIAITVPENSPEQNPRLTEAQRRAPEGPEPPVSLAVREQILKGTIFRRLSSSPEAAPNDTVMTTFDRLSRERAAIADWTGWLEAELGAARGQLDDLKGKVARLEAELEAATREEEHKPDPFGHTYG